MNCLMCGDAIEEAVNAKLGEWRYIHIRGKADHPAILEPVPLTEEAHKERAWFNAWGWRRNTRSMIEAGNAKMWFDRGYAAARAWHERP